MKLYNIVAELNISLDELAPKQVESVTDAIIDALVGYHPAVSRGVFGQTEVVLSVPADSVRQATTTALAVFADATPDREILALTVLATEEYDRRGIFGHVPDLVSVPEAAELLGVTRQRVLQLIGTGALPARWVGRQWVLVRADVVASVEPAGEQAAG